jgi:DNA-binding IclR family transcriptional regulator
VGAELPYNSTSQGRVIIAFAKDDILTPLRKQKLLANTAHSLTDFDAVAKRVARAREQGWASAIQETVLGINAVSVPILAADGDCVAALTLVGTIQHLQEEPTPEQLDALRMAGRSISQALGFRGLYPGYR